MMTSRTNDGMDERVQGGVRASSAASMSQVEHEKLPFNSELDMPADVMHYYRCFAAVKQSILTQCMTTLHAYDRCRQKLMTVAQEYKEQERLINSKPVEQPPSAARQSTLAASYMQMIQMQQAAQQAFDDAIAAAALTHTNKPESGIDKEVKQLISVSFVDDVAASLRPDSASSSSSPPSHSDSPSPTSSPSAPITTPAPPSLSSAQVAAAMSKAVHTAHEQKRARAAREEEQRRAAEEDIRYQMQIAAEQMQEAERMLHSPNGPTTHIHLQEESKFVSTQPLRVGIIGAGMIGCALADRILVDVCGIPPASQSIGLASHVRSPSSRLGQRYGQVRLSISTRRPEQPAVQKLVKRANMAAMIAAATKGHAHAPAAATPMINVYFDNARLLTECHVVFLCVQPHQLAHIAAVIRSLPSRVRPRSQLFFSTLAATDERVLRKQLSADSTSTAPHICVARSQVLLPHVAESGSDVAKGMYDTLLQSICSAMIQSFMVHNAFNSTIGRDGVERAVNEERREMENALLALFHKPTESLSVGTPSGMSQPSGILTPSSSLLRLRHLHDVARQRTSASAIPFVRPTSATSVGVGQSSDSLTRTNTFSATKLPKLADLKEMTEKKEREKEEQNVRQHQQRHRTYDDRLLRSRRNDEGTCALPITLRRPAPAPAPAPAPPPAQADDHEGDMSVTSSPHSVISVT